jgi:hypothetical protein
LTRDNVAKLTETIGGDDLDIEDGTGRVSGLDTFEREPGVWYNRAAVPDAAVDGRTSVCQS